MNARLLLPPLLALFALSCARTAPVAPVKGNPDAEWTLLVYMAADDDLEQAAIDNVVEMAQVGSSASVNVILQVDRADAARNGRGYTRGPMLNLPDFNSTKRLRVEAGRVTELADLGETDTADPEVLSSFVAWGLTTFPAKKTALVLWDHGGATRGFGWDITNGNKPLAIVDANAGITRGLAAAGRTKLDLLGFDACLMANLGVGYELRNVADVFVASEEVEPAHGWSYAPVVRGLHAHQTSRELGKTIVDAFEAGCRQATTTDFCTLAAFDTSKLEGVASSLDGIGERLLARSKSRADWYPVARSRVAAEEYGASSGEASPFSTVDAVDFAAGATRFLGEKNIVAAAMKEATIARYHGAGRPRAHGLSITFPRRGKDRKPVDGTLELGTRAPWQRFLDGYVSFTDADATPPTVSGVAAHDLGGLVEVSGEVEGGDVAQVAAVVGSSDAKGTLTILSTEVLAEGQMTYRWPKLLPVVSDGTVEIPVTVFEEMPFLEETGELVKIASLAGMLHPHGVVADAIDVVLYLKIRADGSTPVVGLYRFTDGGRAGEVKLHPDDRFAPKVKRIDAAGVRSWTPQNETVLLGRRDAIQLRTKPAGAGTYAIGFRVIDYAANHRTATVPFTLR